MKKAPLQFSIPKPCKESFADMPKSGEGRFCGKCETIIYDFSQMTDTELIRFFEAKPETHCGRFHNSQLNRAIEPVTIRNGFFKRFAKIVASVIAILTLRSAPAKAQGEMRPVFAQNPPVNKKSVSTSQEPLLIKGTVKDDEGKPLKDAVVNFDDLKSTTTDENGAYSFELSGINEPHNIYFSCRNYVRTVRTFTPVMRSTSFDVVLGRRDENAEVWSTGIMIPLEMEHQSLGSLPSLVYKGQNYKLTEDMKAMLTVVASALKSHPYGNIDVIAYEGGHIPQILRKRLDLIKVFLVEKQGISADRINTKTSSLGETHTIDIIQAE